MGVEAKLSFLEKDNYIITSQKSIEGRDILIVNAHAVNCDQIRKVHAH